jgi:hypothetical protein
MRGSLHCAAHDGAVSGFGRDDGVEGGGGREQTTASAKYGDSGFARMTTWVGQNDDVGGPE